MYEDILFTKTKNALYFKKISSKKDIDLKENLDGYLITANENECRKIVSFLKSKNTKKLIAIHSDNEQTNRRLIETLNFDYLISPEINSGKDSLKQRSSGLNHVLTKEAAKKDIKMVISLNKLLSNPPHKQIELISRIIQNIKICRKTGCEIKIANFSEEEILNSRQRLALGTSWGMSSNQVSQSIVFSKF